MVQGDSFVTSVVTVLEFGVKPAKEDRQDVVDSFEDLLDELNTEISNIDKTIAVKAYQLRAKYQFLKGLDALQIAVAITLNCDRFVTNDAKLKKVEELSVTLMEE